MEMTDQVKAICPRIFTEAGLDRGQRQQLTDLTAPLQ